MGTFGLGVQRWIGAAIAVAATTAAALWITPAGASESGRDRPLIIQVRAAVGSDIAALSRQALALLEAGHTAEAEAAVEQAMQLQAGRAPDVRVTGVLNAILGEIYGEEGRFREAEQALKTSITALESHVGRGTVADVTPFNTLAGIYMQQQRYDEAEPLFARALALNRKRFGKRPETAESLNSLASLYASMGQPQRAEPLFAEAMEILSAGGPAMRDELAVVEANYGVIEQTLKRYPEAMARFHDAYMTNLAIHGADHPFTMRALSNAGVLYGLMGDPAQGEPLLQAALESAVKTFGDDSLQAAHAKTALGWIEIGLGRAPEALANLRPAVGTYLRVKSLQRRTGAQGGGVGEREVGRAILGLLRAAAMAKGGEPETAALTDEAFQAAQAAHDGKAASALAQTTARFAAGDGPLAGLIREQQDLAISWAKLDGQLTAAYGSPAGSRNPAAEARARQTLAESSARIDQISATVQTSFPAYASLAEPRPLRIADTQALLQPDEALVTITAFGGENGEGTAVFVVTRDAARWRLLDLGLTDLTPQVMALLCGLSAEQWRDDDGARCGQLTGSSVPTGQLPFNAAAAHALYTTLFGDLAPMLAGKTLLVAAGDPLASLPFGVLATGAPAVAIPSTPAELRAVQWLGRSNPIAVIPSVDSLPGLRAPTQIGRAPEPFVGFGDPALTGSRRCPRIPVASACPDIDLAETRVASLAALGAGNGIQAIYRGGGVDVDAVRSLCPLPETALELRCVAESVGADAASIRTGPAATLAELRRSPLDRYRIIEFATHGLVAGELRTVEGALAEPVLVLTPDAANPDDDGLLRGSEIATLKLNADWVVLSACNTAAADQLGGEAMSGLASAFIYAGARSLLVSHWPVRSDTTVRLVTRAFHEMSDNSSVGRAEALRRSVAWMIDRGGDADAHPSAWAPFSLIGASGPIEAR